VYHTGYGCESGCCGHAIEEDGKEYKYRFTHPYGQDARAWAENLIRDEYGAEHVNDLDWENSLIVDD